MLREPEQKMLRIELLIEAGLKKVLLQVLGLTNYDKNSDSLEIAVN